MKLSGQNQMFIRKHFSHQNCCLHLHSAVAI